LQEDLAEVLKILYPVLEVLEEEVSAEVEQTAAGKIFNITQRSCIKRCSFFII
jgi:hypothetical protein